jgi:hypothetical protein
MGERDRDSKGKEGGGSEEERPLETFLLLVVY